MTTNISEFLSLTLQEPLSPSINCYISVDVSPPPPHVSCYCWRGIYANLYRKESVLTKYWIKLSISFVCNVRSINPLFTQIRLNTQFNYEYIQMHSNQCHFTIWFLSVHKNLHFLVKFYTKSVLKSYALSLLLFCIEVRSTLTNFTLVFFVGLST